MGVIVELAHAKKRIAELETEVAGNAKLKDRITELEQQLGYKPTVDLPCPRNLTLRDDIRYLQNERKIEIRNIQPNIWLTTVQDTNSMDPVTDYGHTNILTDNFKAEDLAVGDIVVYEALGMKIMHRIVEISTDEQGRKFTLKGDNNYYKDPYVVRAGHIKWLLLAIIY